MIHLEGVAPVEGGFVSKAVDRPLPRVAVVVVVVVVVVGGTVMKLGVVTKHDIVITISTMDVWYYKSDES